MATVTGNTCFYLFYRHFYAVLFKRLWLAGQQLPLRCSLCLPGIAWAHADHEAAGTHDVAVVEKAEGGGSL